MHTLAFLDPAHFHAALTLGERHPRVRDEIFVYAPEGPDLADLRRAVGGIQWPGRAADGVAASRPARRRVAGSG